MPAQELDDALLPGDVRVPSSGLAGQWIAPSDREHEIFRERVPHGVPIAALERFIRLAQELLIRVHHRHLRIARGGAGGDCRDAHLASATLSSLAGRGEMSSRLP